MGYELHIHVADDPWDEDADPIEGAWAALMARRPDFEHVDEMTATHPVTGSAIRVPGPFHVWRGHPGGQPVPFRVGEACVSVSNPDDDVIAVMVELARALGGQVTGDEGEAYG